MSDYRLWGRYPLWSDARKIESASWHRGAHQFSPSHHSDSCPMETQSGQQGTSLEDYFLPNAAISYKHDKWQAGLNIRNLFNVDFIEGAQNSRTFFISPSEGGTIIGSLSVV